VAILVIVISFSPRTEIPLLDLHSRGQSKILPEIMGISDEIVDYE